MSRISFRLCLSVAAAATAALIVACVGDGPAPTVTTPAEDSGAPPPGLDSGHPEDSSTPDSADAGGGDASPKRFCDTQAPLTGVSDFFCADFDGTKPDEGFTRALIPDGGAFTVLTDVFFSPPASVTTKGGATLVWEKVGATPFTEIDAQVRVNLGNLGGVVAPTSGAMRILEVSSIDSNLGIYYTHGGPADGTQNYTGYYVQFSSCPSACLLFTKKITTPLPTNVFTDVQLIWVSSGLVKVTYNGVSVLEFSGASSTSTKVTATLGLVPQGAPPGMGLIAYDNFIVSVKRGP